MKRFQVWAIVAAAALALLITYLGQQQMLGTTVNRSVGTPDVGGAFTLVDHNGQTVTDQTFAGELLFVAFGFTYCPDICPATLQRMTAVMDQLEADGAAVRPMMISIDPARDTPEVLAEYLRHFHPRFVGLTGSDQQIADVARAYKVYYAKAPTGAEDGDYLMDHSSLLYLMDGSGRYLAHFSHQAEIANIAAAIKRHL